MLDFFFPLSQTKLWPYYTGTAYPSSCLSWVQGLLTLLPAYPGFRDCLPFFLPTLGSGTAYPSSCPPWVQGLLTLLPAYPGFIPSFLGRVHVCHHLTSLTCVFCFVCLCWCLVPNVACVSRLSLLFSPTFIYRNVIFSHKFLCINIPHN
jgi:hypothetical protein